MWYRKYIGGERCPIVDTWWQTETGGIMITPLPGITATKPGAAMTPFPGISAEVVDSSGRPVRNGGGGFLTLDGALAEYCGASGGMTSVTGRHTGRALTASISPATAPRRDDDGDIWLLGRVDDVMNISGHRISTTEVESALVSYPGRCRSGRGRGDRPYDRPGHRRIRDGEGIGCGRCWAGQKLISDLREHVAQQIGKIARPRQILLTPDLPKTVPRQDHAATPAGCGRAP